MANMWMTGNGQWQHGRGGQIKGLCRKQLHTRKDEYGRPSQIPSELFQQSKKEKKKKEKKEEALYRNGFWPQVDFLR